MQIDKNCEIKSMNLARITARTAGLPSKSSQMPKKVDGWISNQQSQIKKLKDVQEISCLYSEHIYKSFKNDHFFQAQLEKYKNMYEKEKKQKVKLLMQQREWEEEKRKVLAEKQVILFALDSLTIKAAEEEGKQNEVAHLISKRNSSRMSRKKDQRLIQRKDQNISKQNDNIVHRGHKTEKPTKFSTTRKQVDHKSPKNNESKQEGQAKNGNFDKLKLIKKLKQKLNIKNTQAIEGIFDISQESQKSKIQMNQGYKMMVQKIQVQQVQIIDYEKEIKGLKNIIETQKNEIQKKQHKNNELIEEIQQISQQNDRKNRQLKKIKQENYQLNERLQEFSERNSQLENQLRLTQEQYSRKEEKERHCVKVLQRFSMQLKLNDEKIQQFITNQFDNLDQQEKGLERSKKTYHEHLSYILHLCKKKQTLYENLVQDFKERVKQSDFRNIILEKKLKLYGQFYGQVKKGLQREDCRQQILEIVGRFKK